MALDAARDGGARLRRLRLFFDSLLDGFTGAATSLAEPESESEDCAEDEEADEQELSESEDPEECDKGLLSLPSPE